MELTKLAEKQKRLRTLQQLCNQEVKNEELRSEFVKVLKVYGRLLADCWERNEITAADVARMEDVERQLDRLHGLARAFPVAGRLN